MKDKNFLYQTLRVMSHFNNYIKVLPQIKDAKKKENIIWCESYIKQNKGKFINNNWGDDLNKYFFEYVTGREVVFLPFTNIHPFFPVDHFSLIGSIIGFYRMDNMIIYGSGLIDPGRKLTGRPKKILSVRGPKTRAALLEKGLDCPAVYGDPALLIPLFYEPKAKKKKIITVIYNEATSIEEVKSWIERCSLDIPMRILSMNDYKEWTDIIDAIVESEYIISESLHGLIVAEAYGIPSAWVEFIQHKSFWNFKYEDFYESIGKFGMKSVKAMEEGADSEIKLLIEKWKPGRIDYELMLKTFPFPIKCNFKNK